MGIQLSALLGQFEAACTAADELAEAATAHFEQHPDADDHHQLPRTGDADRRPGARRDRR